MRLSCFQGGTTFQTYLLGGTMFSAATPVTQTTTVKKKPPTDGWLWWFLDWPRPTTLFISTKQVASVGLCIIVHILKEGTSISTWQQLTGNILNYVTAQGDELPFDCSGQETFPSLLLSWSWRRELVEKESAARSPLCAACPSVSQFINEAIHPHLVTAPNAPLANLLPTLGSLTARREKKEKSHSIDFPHVAGHAAESCAQLVRGSQSIIIIITISGTYVWGVPAPVQCLFATRAGTDSLSVFMTTTLEGRKKNSYDSHTWLKYN